jgi:hypothetical protein
MVRAAGGSHIGHIPDVDPRTLPEAPTARKLAYGTNVKVSNDAPGAPRADSQPPEAISHFTALIACAAVTLGCLRIRNQRGESRAAASYVGRADM